MTIDPTITTGNLITAGTILGGWLIFTARKSYGLGTIREGFQKDFEQLRDDVKDIKKYIDDQHKEELVRLKAEGASGTTIQLMQYRIDLHEREMQRLRANVHRIAQAAQVRLLSMEEVDTGDHGR